MALYTVEVSQVVRDVLACTLEIEADSLEAAKAEAMRQWQDREFDLHFSHSLDSDEAEVFAWEAAPCGK